MNLLPLERMSHFLRSILPAIMLVCVFILVVHEILFAAILSL
jgi:hypothetical protein